MSFSIGIIGLPNVGKSTLFKALTKKQVDASNYPFCTIDPNVGIVQVPDKRLTALAKISKSQKIIPTAIEFVDIAGLVKGAHKGEGLGNKFLAHIREVDAICQVVRDFHNPDVTHVEGKVNPKEDIQIINLELIMADLETITKRIKDIEAKARSGDKELVKLLAIYQKIKAVLDKGELPSLTLINDEEKILVKDLGLLTLKPMLYVLNVDEKNINKNNLPHRPVRHSFNEEAKAGQLSTVNCQLSIPISAKIESEIAELPPAEQKAYLADLGLKQSGLDALIAASYKLLNLITYLTSGPEETRAWTITKGTKAPKAAAKIHTDFEKDFIKAEVINYKDFVNTGSELAAKEKGLMHLEGKNYTVQDGDVIYFKI
ncbi:redox-regulated ATPase YchF [Candidatus Falkowbacteria bacterium]|nr:redox-regulated ATPase YchF [Candidatus Falkowbacteria bacterium]